ncbi:MAG TPA: hypothetical protein VFS49_00960, partial [Croceibacterium sp.]|nr:hypothetical protein [Croceibacterium sp.]
AIVCAGLLTSTAASAASQPAPLPSRGEAAVGESEEIVGSLVMIALIAVVAVIGLIVILDDGDDSPQSP